MIDDRKISIMMSLLLASTAVTYIIVSGPPRPAVSRRELVVR
jgi:hypothetical protein